jgi:hypothetical protein
MITPQELLANKPSEDEVDRVDQMWAMMDSTTQFLNALLQVLKSRELDNEHAALEKFVAEMAQVEAKDMNTPILPADQTKEFWRDPCWRDKNIFPITQRQGSK